MKSEILLKLDKAGFIASDPHASSKVHQDLTCKICNKVWNLRPRTKIQESARLNVYGCPDCHHSTRFVDIRSDRYDSLMERFEILITKEEFITLPALAKVEVYNRYCQHTFRSTINNLSKIECPVCNKIVKTQHLRRMATEKSKLSKLRKKI